MGSVGSAAPRVSGAKARPISAISPKAATQVVAMPRSPPNQDTAMTPAISGPAAVMYRPTLLASAIPVARTLGGKSSGP